MAGWSTLNDGLNPTNGTFIPSKSWDDAIEVFVRGEFDQQSFFRIEKVVLGGGLF